MSALAQTLVGRDTELDLLERVLDDACAGSSRFVVVTGEPGIGKRSPPASRVGRPVLVKRLLPNDTVRQPGTGSPAASALPATAAIERSAA